MFPNYNLVLDEKKKCYPNNCIYAEESFSVSVYDLLDHTLKRLLESIINHGGINNLVGDNLIFKFKYGFDGTTSNSGYKQNFCDKSQSDSFLFNAFLCPLSLQVDNKIIYENKSPGDSKLCRPLLIKYARETEQLTKEVANKIKIDLETCTPFTLLFKNESMEKKFNVTLLPASTMLDGKAMNAITGNAATTRCRICKNTFKGFKGTF